MNKNIYLMVQCMRPIIKQWRCLFLARAIVALAIVASSGDQRRDGFDRSLRRRYLSALPGWSGSGKGLRGSSLEKNLVLPPVRRELHSKSAKSKSTKSKSSKSKSLKNVTISEISSNSSSISSKGSKSSTSKSGKSKSAKGSDSKSAKVATMSKHSFDTTGSEDFHKSNSSNDNLELPTEDEANIIPPNEYSDQKNASLVLNDNMELLDHPDLIPNSEYTIVKMVQGHDPEWDEANATSSSSYDGESTEDRSNNGEPTNLKEDSTTEVRVAKDGESDLIESEANREKDEANVDLVENEAILDISSESLE